ncbi:UNVERIFIED_CONTAM: hypothetical protein FKN15_049723 [Acipenser sinensis]
MGKKSRQQQKLQEQREDPASLFPCCEEDEHNWDGCPYAQAQASAATPVAPVPLSSPSSREIWDWLVDAEGDRFKDLPLAINALWWRDGEQWEVSERQHHPASLPNTTAMVLRYLAEDMAEIPAFQVPEWVELPSCEPEGVELPSTEKEGEEPTLQSPDLEEEKPPSPELEGEELKAQPPVFFVYEVTLHATVPLQYIHKHSITIGVLSTLVYS